MPIVLYLIGCALMGVLGNKRKFGFWGFFMLSVIFTPIIVGLVLAVSSEDRRFQQD